MGKMKTTLLAMGLILITVSANAKTVRATEMGPAMWSELAHGKLGDVVVEFRQGDELPLTFEAQGDLIETRRATVSYVDVKKNFWLRPSQNDLQISFDGTTFKKITDALTGSLEAGAGSAQTGGVADAINIVFKSFVK